MGLCPTEPTVLGKFFDYPQEASVGMVAAYWLATSPAGNHLVRMTPGCKRAFLATVEAVLERAVVPAGVDDSVTDQTDLRAATLGGLPSVTIKTLVDLGAWAAPQGRAGLGARLRRGCPREDWTLLVTRVAELWRGSATSVAAGTVYPWQLGMLDFSTNGWVEADEGDLVFDDAGPVFNLSAFFADAAARMSDIPVLRPWGVFGGGSGASPVTDWLIDALESFGPSVTIGSDTEPIFAEGELDGEPAPLAEGHEGNWFGSTSGGMVVERKVSVRRSSSAWGVLQSMLVNMRFTHLLFPYSVVFNQTKRQRMVFRLLTMDEDLNIVAEDWSDETTETFETTTSNIESWAECEDEAYGTAYVECAFLCLDEDVTSDNQLVRFDQPQAGIDGWVHIGRSLYEFVTLGLVHSSTMAVTLNVYKTTSIASVAAANGHAYPAEGFQQYISEHGGVTFADAESYWQIDETTDPDWTRYSVRHETGNLDLAVPVRRHAEWLLQQLPTPSLPSIPECPGILGPATSAFHDGWEVRYTPYPNCQVDGDDAYFPIAFRNVAFVEDTGFNIAHDDNGHLWSGSSGSLRGAVLGPTGQAFPGLDISSYHSGVYKIQQYGSAMAAYKWRFKAMPDAPTQ